MNGLCSKSFRKNKSKTNLGDWRKNSIVTLRDTLCSKIKRPKGLLLLLNGIPIVGKIFRNLGQGGYRLQRPEAREFVSSSACFETQGRRKFWKSVASINTVGIICPPGWDRVTFSVKIWLGAWAPGPLGSGNDQNEFFMIPRVASSFFNAVWIKDTWLTLRHLYYIWKVTSSYHLLKIYWIQ